MRPHGSRQTGTTAAGYSAPQTPQPAASPPQRPGASAHCHAPGTAPPVQSPLHSRAASAGHTDSPQARPQPRSTAPLQIRSRHSHPARPAASILSPAPRLQHDSAATASSHVPNPSPAPSCPPTQRSTAPATHLRSPHLRADVRPRVRCMDQLSSSSIRASPSSAMFRASRSASGSSSASNSIAFASAVLGSSP